MIKIMGLLIGLTALSLARSAVACNNQSLVIFLSKGRQVPSEVFSSPRDCSFGGNNVFTPKNRIRVFVNFNIPGTVDLDELDAAFDRFAAGTRQGEFMQDPSTDFAVAFVQQSWIQGRFPDAWHGAGLNSAKRGLYISEYNLQDGSLASIYEYFFKNTDLWFNPAAAPTRPGQRQASPGLEI